MDIDPTYRSRKLTSRRRGDWLDVKVWRLGWSWDCFKSAVGPGWVAPHFGGWMHLGLGLFWKYERRP